MRKIQEQFNEVIKYSQHMSEVNSDQLFANWYKAKIPIVNGLFGGSLIHETKEVCFELSEESKIERFQSFIDWVYELGDSCKDLTEFLDHISTDEFYDNKMKNSYNKICKGTKVVKAFKYFLPKDSQLLKDLQNRASEIIQENKVKGILCFSVHPLDYLSSSENQFHWRSCHALDGEFRAGNLSYMGDNHTIVCYLKSKDLVKLPNFPENVEWNNKKWRCLLYLDSFSMPNCIFAGRQYPFYSPGSLNVVKEEFLKLAKRSWPWAANSCWTEWTQEVIKEHQFDNGFRIHLSDPYYPINSYLIPEDELIQDVKHPLHYNDLLYSTCYKPYYMFRYVFANQPKFVIGSSVKCLRCGEHEISTRDTMMCPTCELEYGHSECDDYTTCDHCGNRCLQDSTVWVEDDEVCEHCAETHTFVCSECGRRYYNDSERYDATNDRYVCKYCYTEEEEE